MPPRKPFLLRIDPQLLEAVQRWSNAEMRSLNGQIEYLLRDALRRAGRLPKSAASHGEATPETESERE
jgi:hypothetical protein